MKASNLSATADTLQQYMHWTFMLLCHSLSAPVFYYSLLLDLCDFHAVEIFSLGAKGMRMQLLVPLLLFQYSLGTGQTVFVLPI
jgi:hypothetical protein